MKKIPFLIVTLYLYVPTTAVISLVIAAIAVLYFNAGETAVAPFFAIIAISFFTGILSIISSIIGAVIILTDKTPADEYAQKIKRIKLIHIPAYVIIFPAAVFCFIVFHLVPVAILLAVADLTAVISTGILMTASLSKCAIEHSVTKTSAVINSALSFIYVIDVISAILLCHKLSNRKKELH